MGGGGGAAMLVYTSRKHVHSLNPLQVKSCIPTSLKGKSLRTRLANIYTHVTQYTCKCTCSCTCICVMHVHVLFMHCACHTKREHVYVQYMTCLTAQCFVDKTITVVVSSLRSPSLFKRNRGGAKASSNNFLCLCTSPSQY